MLWQRKNPPPVVLVPRPVSIDEYLSLLEREIKRLEEEYNQKMKQMDDLIRVLRKEDQT